MKWFRNKRILVPFDFSDDSVQAVEVALQILDRHADVHILHVVEPLPANDPFVTWEADGDAKRKEAARKNVQDKLAHLGKDEFHIDIGMGSPANVIVKLAEEIDIGLIIIPSHGLTGLSRLMMGSVSERVVRLAHCPVLVLKDPPKARA